MLTGARHTVIVQMFVVFGRSEIMFCRRTRIALAGVVSLLLLAGLALALLGGAGDASAQVPIDYDADNDNLIDITTLAQLDAIRHDLDGNGYPAAGAGTTAYNAAFPGRATGMGCRTACAGYELRADLDFDTDDSGDVDSNDDYPSWTPIGTTATSTAPFTSTFRGNDHTIANMTIDATDISPVGLFGTVRNGTIEGVGMTGVDIDVDTTSSYAALTLEVGGLIGVTRTATVRACYATGEITTTVVGGAATSIVGGLVGNASGAGGTSIAASYAAVTVTANSTSTADPASFPDTVGGLVGRITGISTRPGSVTASYATGAVEANRTGSGVGGLIGRTGVAGLIGQTGIVTVTASYATGTVTGPTSTSATRGLIDDISPAATVTDSYWDVTTSGIADDSGDDAPEGKTTTELQSPTGYTDIYAGWNVDVDNADGDNDVTTGPDDPWDFGTDTQYPMLQYDIQDIAGPVDPMETVDAPPIIYNLNIRFDARRIALPEGHTASYRVRLAGPPSGSSKIGIRSDNPDVSPSPAELTFTAANWNQWQTVKISIAGDANSTDESATLAHYGPNRGYGSVLVSVTDTGDSRQAGDTPPPALAVITEPGARWGVTAAATVPADLAADGVVRVSSAYGAPRTATGYSLGRSGVAQAIVSIAGPADVPASGLTVCLPVARALAEEAGERRLTLLRYVDAGDDGASWQAVSGAEYDAVGRRVCAGGVTEFGVFAAAYVLPQ